MFHQAQPCSPPSSPPRTAFCNLTISSHRQPQPYTYTMNAQDIDRNGDILLTITASDARLSTRVSSMRLTSGSKFFATLLSPTSCFTEATGFKSHDPETGPFPLAMNVADLGLRMTPMLEILRILHCPELTENVTSYPKTVRRLLPLAQVVDYLDCKEGVRHWSEMFLGREMVTWEMDVRKEVDALLFCGFVFGSNRLLRGVVRWCVMNGTFNEGGVLVIPGVVKVGDNKEEEDVCDSCGADLPGEGVTFLKTPNRVVRAVGEKHKAAVRIIARGLVRMMNEMCTSIYPPRTYPYNVGTTGEFTCRNGKRDCTIFVAGVAMNALSGMGVLDGTSGLITELKIQKLVETWRGKSVRELMKMLEKAQKASDLVFQVGCERDDRECEPFALLVLSIKADVETMMQTLKVTDFPR